MKKKIKNPTFYITIFRKARNILRTLSVFSLITLGFASRSHGQIDFATQNAIPQTPNVASLSKFIDFPVSLYTGQAKINIPIYNLKVGNLNVPVSLGYHTGGIKVEEIASWAGLGWALNAGGNISRSVNGQPDEFGTHLFQRPPHIMGYEEFLNYYYYSTGAYDSQHDEYFFNMPGYSGKFVLDFENNYKPVLVPKQKIKIIKNNVSAYFTFLIKGTDGTKYFFEEKSNTHIVTTKTPGEVTSSFVNYPTTWYLTKIESANSDHFIEFQYEDEILNYDLQSSETRYIKIRGGNCKPSVEIFQREVFNTISKRLSRITGSDGTVIAFHEGPERCDLSNSHLLNEITITRPDGVPFKKFRLGHQYLVSGNYHNISGYDPSNYENDPDFRLMLMSVSELGYDEVSATYKNTGKTYEMDYYNEHGLPGRFSHRQDHWGYYNGEVYSTPVTLIPPVHHGGKYYEGGDRMPREEYAKEGALKDLVHPTKGKTSYEYELNDCINNIFYYYPYEGASFFSYNAGGLRVSKSTDYDPVSQKSNVKRFEYYDGFLNSYCSYTRYAEYPDFEDNLYCDHPIMSACAYLVRSSHSNTPLNFTSGGYVGYDKVIVHYGENSENGYTVNEFFSGNEHPDKIIYPQDDWEPNGSMSINIGPSEDHDIFERWEYPYAPLDNKDWKRGLLKKSTFYNSDGAVVKSMTNEYKFYDDPTQPYYDADELIGVKVGSELTMPQGSGLECGFLKIAYYKILSSKYELTAQAESIYHQNNVFVTKTNFEYENPDHLLLTKSTQTDVNNKTIVTDYVYPSDVGSNAPPEMWDETNANFRHMFSPVVDKTVTVNGAPVSKTHTAYVYDPDRDMVLPDYTAIYPTGTGENYQIDYEHDDKGNITRQAKENDIPTYYLWAYNNQYPVVKITSSDTTLNIAGLQAGVDGKTFSGSDTVPGTSADIGKLEDALSPVLNRDDCMVTYYTYKPLVGMTSQTGPNGITVYYGYDAFGRLEYIKDNDGKILKYYNYHYAGQ